MPTVPRLTPPPATSGGILTSLLDIGQAAGPPPPRPAQVHFSLKQKEGELVYLNGTYPDNDRRSGESSEISDPPFPG